MKSSLAGHNTIDMMDGDKGNGQDAFQSVKARKGRGILATWEAQRPRLLAEMAAEGIGAFIYVWCGCGAACAFFVSGAEGMNGFGSLFTVGLVYGLAVCFGIYVAGPTSGGHINPGYTIAFALFKGFPWRKVPFYIVAQVFGAFIGALVVYVQYKQPLDALTEAAKASPGGAASIFSPAGVRKPAGNFAFFTAPGQSLGYVFINEFVANVVMAIIVFGVMDPTNFCLSQAAIPVVIGLTLATLIWSYGLQSIALNSARDVGGRLAALVIWGKGACPPKYSLLAALTNLIATPIGALIQRLFLSDSGRMVVHKPPPPRVDELPSASEHRSELQTRPATPLQSIKSVHDPHHMHDEIALAALGPSKLSLPAGDVPAYRKRGYSTHTFTSGSSFLSLPEDKEKRSGQSGNWADGIVTAL